MLTDAPGVTPEQMARDLYEIRERLAPEYGQHPLPISFDGLPTEAKNLLIATAFFYLDARNPQRPSCSHDHVKLRRTEVAQCQDCGLYSPAHDGYGFKRG